MLETPHVAVGAAIATKIPNPFISIPLALVSHIVMDQIPHWNPHSYTEVKTKGKISDNTRYLALVDVTAALALGFFAASRVMPDTHHATTIIFSSFAAVFPDVSKAPYFLLGKRSGLIKKWVDFERSLQVETSFWVGMLIQAIVIVACIAWIL
jgi:hypothetical protein